MTKEFKKNKNPNPNYIPPMSNNVVNDYTTVLFYEQNETDWFFCTTVNGIIPNKNDCVIIDNKLYAVEKRVIDYEVGLIYVFVKYLNQIKRCENDKTQLPI